MVTSKWVKDVSTAAVYVSPDGNDNNSGMTAAESVKTISRAIEIGSSSAKSGGVIRITAAAGNYTESIDIKRISCVIEMGGTISLSGRISVNSGKLWFLRQAGDTSSQLNIASDGARALNVEQNGFFFAHKVNITASNTDNAVMVCYRGIVMTDNLTITTTNLTNEAAILVAHGSFIRSAVIDLSGSKAQLRLYTGSVGVVDTSLIINSTSTNNGIYVSHFSFLWCGASTTISVNQTCAFSSMLSGIYFNTTVNATHNSGRTFVSSEYAAVHFNGNVTTTATSSADTCFYTTASGTIGLYGSNLSVSGTYTNQIVYCAYNSYFTLNANATVTNNATGKQYTCYTGGQISVGGKGANRLPGTTGTGSASAAQFAYYG